MLAICYYTVSQKNDTDVTHYRFNAHQPISVIFGRDVAEFADIFNVLAAECAFSRNFKQHSSILHEKIQESPAVADKPARRLRKVCTVYVRAVGL